VKQNEYHPATDDGGAKYARYVPAENGGNVYKFLRRVSQIVSRTGGVGLYRLSWWGVCGAELL